MIFYILLVVTFGICVQAARPNIVIFLADDLGFADLSITGHPTSSTPNIDKLAAGGLLFTNFYSASAVCSPSRAALLTAKYPIRTGVWPGVFTPNSIGGLPEHTHTLASLLAENGYSTALLGKWHLGVGENKQYLPTEFGFQKYLGIPYSHDMCPCPVCFPPNKPCSDSCGISYVSCPLFYNENIVQQPADLLKITEELVLQGDRIISKSASSQTPLFLMVAFYQTHHPQFASYGFFNTSQRGRFGDALSEMDSAVGRVIKSLVDNNILENTFVFFTSDNGPSILREQEGGCAGPLRCGKGTTYEGGMRVPAIAFWKGRVRPGRRTQLMSMLDIMPTVLKMAGIHIPDDLNGVDASDVIFSDSESPRDSFLYYPESPTKSTGVYAIRYGKYKAHFYTEGNALSGSDNYDFACRPDAKLRKHQPPLLYDLDTDPGERYDLGRDQKYRTVVQLMTKLKKRADEQMEWAPSEINKGTSNKAEPCCNDHCNPFPTCCDCSFGKQNNTNDHNNV